MYLFVFIYLSCISDAPVLTIERLYEEDDDSSPPGKADQSVQELAAPPTNSSTQTSPEKYTRFSISPSLPVLVCVLKLFYNYNYK